MCVDVDVLDLSSRQARLVCIPVRWSVLRPFVPRQQHLASIVSNRAPKGITKVIAHIVIEFRDK